MFRRLFFLDCLGLALFLAVSGGLAYRITAHLGAAGAPPHVDHWGMKDFRDAIYYPLQAWRDGKNPYDAPRFKAEYPIEHPIPLYSPLTLLVHAPFGFLPWRAAATAYLGVSLVLCFAAAWLALKQAGLQPSWGAVGLAATLLVLSRPGMASLNWGQLTLPVVLATLVALGNSRQRPWLAGLALALTTYKPTFGAPLGLLLLCRGDWKTVLIGAGLGALGVGVGVALLLPASGGWEGFLAALQANYDFFEHNPSVAPTAEHSLRLDVYAVACRLLDAELGDGWKLAAAGMIVAAAGSVLFLHRRSDEHGAAGLSGAVISLAVLLTMYHQAYDGLLVLGPLAAIAVARSEPWRSAPRSLRWTLVALLGWQAVNFFWTASVTTRLDGLFAAAGLDAALWSLWVKRLALASNGLALAGAFALLVVWGWARAWAHSRAALRAPRAIAQRDAAPA